MERFERVVALSQLLKQKACSQTELLEQLANNYPTSPQSARVMLQRDLNALEALGFRLLRTGRPRRYQIIGSYIPFEAVHLQSLALIRDSFGANHPQYEQITELLAVLTQQLSPQQQDIYFARQTSSVPLQPAIDYRPHASNIRQLEKTISQHTLIDFIYHTSTGKETRHHVEPHNIEYREQHFYLEAYSYDSKQILDFRVDRIFEIRERQSLPPHLSKQHQRQVIRFRYRLAAMLARGEISKRFDQQQVVEYLENGDAIIEAEGNNAFFIRRTLLKYAGNAELLEPEWLRNEFLADLRELLKVYEQFL
jgi:predicted DNA-binding transcriptional regulator YafY